MNNLLELQKQFETTTPLEQRKLKGQFFTPPKIAHFMAGLFDVPISKTFRLLDPGAGIGALSSAFCERVSRFCTSHRLEIHLFESDEVLLPLLRRSM
jgi:adenine-specific DNA-methyltransferase